MAYSNFTIKQLIEDFGLIQEKTDLFGSSLPPIESSNWLKESLELGLNLPLNSEKAKSEALIAPILYEIKRRNLEIFTIYSGMNLIADSDRGLVGECDFVLAKEDRKYLAIEPIFSLLEAKESNISLGIPQCIAQMFGAQILNKKNKHNFEHIYGCVTTGEIWQFMKLEKQTVWIDERRYYIDRVERILGVLQWIVDQYQ